MSDQWDTLEREATEHGAAERVVAPPIVSVEQRSRAPGWIWAVPVAAVAIVGWLAFKQFATTGPEITVVFAPDSGVGAGTSVQYQSVGVGQVESAALDKDLQHLRARIRMDAAMRGHLGAGTQFWVSGPTLSNLATIKSIISGPTIGVFPQKGRAQREYTALAEPPLMEGLVPGRSFVLSATDLGKVGHGSAVLFRGLTVGSVQSSRLLPDKTFQARFFVEAPYDALVQEDSRFWSAGNVQFSMSATGPHLQVPPIGALLSGAVAFDSPDTSGQGAAEAAAGHRFTLYGSQGEADLGPDRFAVAYRTVFGADAGAVSEGAPVMLAGKQVGTVQHSALHYDKATGKLMQPVTMLIEPSRLGLPAGEAGQAELGGVMQQLVDQGLRAEPGSVIPLVGPADVELAFVHGAPAATLSGTPPELPVAPGGGGIGGIVTALNGISGKLNALPLDQIAGDIHVATARLAEFSKSRALADSLARLEQSVDNLERTSASVRADLPAVLTSLRATMHEAQGTAAEARQMLAGLSGKGAVGVNSASLSQALYQLTRAAQSMRELADYLARNPSALVRGRQ